MTTPKLTHYAQFESLLAGYHMSIRAQHILDTTPFVLMVAASGSGRNTIIEALIQSGRYYFIISDTTRPPRVNNGVLEKNGVEYFFRAEEDMLQDIKKGRFVEAAIIHRQQVSGVSVREIEKAQSLGKIAITDVEIVGADHIVRLKPDALAIFVLPPSFKEWLIRIQKRNPQSPQELQRRLQSAVQEFEAALTHNYYLYVINDTLEHAIEQVDTIARFGKIDKADQNKAKVLLRELISDTKKYLQTQLGR